MNKKHQIVIIGAGTAGVSVAARLAKKRDQNLDIAIIDPSTKHYYQPQWTLVGAGVFDKAVTEKKQEDVLPKSVRWYNNKVESFHPANNIITLENSEKIEYEYLIVTAGIQMDWHKIEGLKETLGKNGVCSNYSFDTVDKTWEYIKNLKPGDKALFTQPPMPIKCAGAPQKILYLAEEFLVNKGIRQTVDIDFYLAGPKIFGVEKYKEALEKVLVIKNLNPHYEHNLVSIDGENKTATFQIGNELITKKFTMIHVVPPMSSPNFIKNSPLANDAGWVNVDKFTTQHIEYKNVFSIGDCSSLPTSRTAAAIRKQAPILVKNLLSLMHNKPLTAKYDGYASCPLVTGYKSCILAEFDYDGNPMETFPFNQAKERYSMYLMKAYGLPLLYWEGMLKGRV